MDVDEVRFGRCGVELLDEEGKNGSRRGRKRAVRAFVTVNCKG